MPGKGRDMERRMESVELQVRQLQQTAALSSGSTPANHNDLPLTFLLQPREFEKTLYDYRMYRRTEHNSKLLSFTTSIARESAWSALSKYSLGGDISILSVVALPVYVSELSTGWTLFLNGAVDDGVTIPSSMSMAEAVNSIPKRGGTARGAAMKSRGPQTRPRKIAIVGARNVGKASLTVQFVDGHYVDSYYHTTENTFSKLIRYRGQDFDTAIVDTVGQDEITILNNRHFIGIHGYMIVYSVGSRQSFKMVKVIRDKICNHLATDDVPVMLVGNHCELHQLQRHILYAEGVHLAEEMGCGFIEASARNNENVNQAFEGLIAEIEKSQESLECSNSKCRLM